ncbi:MAG: PqqD family peptide modification chaperone, partial [Chloroflexi bacterium]
TYWILKNLRTDAYLRLTAEQVFLWEQMDGKSSVQDIVIAYMMQYGKLAINSLLTLLEQLQQKGFIEPLVDVYGSVNETVAKRRANVLWRRMVRGFFNTEFAIGGIDKYIAASYRNFGRLLFSPAIQWIMLVVIAAGGTAFVGMLLGLIDRDVAVIGGAGAIIGIVTLYLLQFITLLLHEWAHAVTTKHYGREVRRGGFLLYMGMPAAFVDTTDIWMEPRRPRIVVSWAGPHSGFFLGGLASLLILVVPGAFAQGVLYQFAFLTYLTSFMNLNPLLKMDGYYILMDWLEIPRLRERSLAFIGKPLREKLRRRAPFTREEKIFAVFGVLSGVWTVIALIVIIFTLGGYLLQAAQTLPGLIVIVALVLFVAYRRISRRLRQMRMSRRKKSAATRA